MQLEKAQMEIQEEKRSIFGIINSIDLVSSKMILK